MILMREFSEVQPKNLITLRNQRGYGTQKNWMGLRQELLHYVIEATLNSILVVHWHSARFLKVIQRREWQDNGKPGTKYSESTTIRPGNVWVDIQQVFYRMEENVPGCLHKNLLKRSRESSNPVVNMENWSLYVRSLWHVKSNAGERLNRKIYTCDNNPIFGGRIDIRQLEHFRSTQKTGWQWHNPFPELEINGRC